jgi:hypothetical protein
MVSDVDDGINRCGAFPHTCQPFAGLVSLWHSDTIIGNLHKTVLTRRIRTDSDDNQSWLTQAKTLWVHHAFLGK